MADEDEDAALLRGSNPAEDNDLSEEIQDYRFLNKLSAAHDTGNLALPKRGEKDFEAHSTQQQQSTLEASRQAMHDVLSWTRVHTPKNHLVGYYHEEGNMVYMEKVKSSLFQTIGRSKGGKEWLLPEEALFMLERGSLDVRWPVKEAKDGEKKEGVSMSLQGAYAAFLGFEGGVGGKLTMEMYTVYAGLKRSGYIVFRAGSWDDETPPVHPFDPLNQDQKQPQAMWFSRFFAEIWRRLSSSSVSQLSPEQLHFGPLIKPGLYRSYADIYRLLSLIPTHDHRAPPMLVLPPATPNPYRLTFDIWKTSGTGKFRKSQRPPPDFRVAVVNARDTPLPTAAQLNDLLATVPYDPPGKGGQLYGRLKHGTRSVVLAVVDNGIPSYLKFSDASNFADEKLYESTTKAPRGKGGGRGRGGRGGGRGRGRGRGG